MFTGYLQLGGVEIANSDRLAGYLRTAECSGDWYRGAVCDTLQAALGDSTYTAENISAAPWYDPVNPDVSSRFFGVSAYDVAGIHDSSRSIAVTQAIKSGGVLGNARNSTKEVRVKAVLIAQGEDALDYGLNWLNSQLEPGACGQHGDACGLADLAFLTTCPPEYPLDWSSTAGEVISTNLFINPNASSTDPTKPGRTLGWMLPAAAPMQDTSWGSQGTSFRISETPEPSGFRVLPQTAVFLAAEGTITAQAVIKIPEGYDPTGDDGMWNWGSGDIAPYRSLTVSAQTGSGAVWDTAVIPSTPGEHAVSVSLEIPPGEITSAVTLVLAPPAEDAQYYLADQVTLTNDDGAVGPFSGASEGYGVRPSIGYRWAGQASESPSEAYGILWSSAPDEAAMDAEMAQIERFMHDVGVTSGPTVREYLESSSDPMSTKGALVEFTVTSERGYIYSRGVDVPLLTTPDVAEDVPHNRFHNPTTDTTAGRNWVRRNRFVNPSLETNATGWAIAGRNASTEAAVTVTGGRVTGELRAVGNASMKAIMPTPVTAGLSLETVITATSTISPDARPGYIGIWGGVTDPNNLVTRLRAEYRWGTGPWLLLAEAPNVAAAKSGYTYRSQNRIAGDPSSGELQIRFIATGGPGTAASQSFSAYADAAMFIEG